MQRTDQNCSFRLRQTVQTSVYGCQTSSHRQLHVPGPMYNRHHPSRHARPLLLGQQTCRFVKLRQYMIVAGSGCTLALERTMTLPALSESTVAALPAIA